VDRFLKGPARLIDLAHPAGAEREKMNSEFLLVLGVVIVWIVLNRWILPKLGVRT
jgi:hypothetical protein